MHYRLQIASDVIRDGLGIELVTEDHRVVAQVFRSDREKTLSFFMTEQELPFIEIERLSSSKDVHQTIGLTSA
jgi:hypothetical protein